MNKFEAEKLAQMDYSALLCECEKLDPGDEKLMAEERLAQDVIGWPEYRE